MSNDRNSLLHAFLVYVRHARPVLEYNSVIWSPHHKQDIDVIEYVQHSKHLSGLSAYSDLERL